LTPLKIIHNNKISFDDKVYINCRALTIDEAIGNPERKDYPYYREKRFC